MLATLKFFLSGSSYILVPNPRPVPESPKESSQELGNRWCISDHIGGHIFYFVDMFISCMFLHLNKHNKHLVTVSYGPMVPQEVAEKAAQDPPPEAQGPVSTEKPAAKEPTETKETKETNEVKAVDWDVGKSDVAGKHGFTWFKICVSCFLHMYECEYIIYIYMYIYVYIYICI